MKHIHVILTVLISACLGGKLWAQPPGQRAAPMIAPAGIKIGLVNMGVLMRDHEKVKVLKAKVDVKVKPFEEKSKEIEKCVNSWTEALRNPDRKLTEDQRYEGQKILLECRRRLEVLAEQYHKEIGAELGQELVALNAEVKQALKVYAETNGYHLILAYGEPETPLPVMADFERRMTSIDAGNISFMPLPGTEKQDVTRSVLDLLNASYRASLGERRK